MPICACERSTKLDATKPFDFRERSAFRLARSYIESFFLYIVKAVIYLSYLPMYKCRGFQKGFLMTIGYTPHSKENQDFTNGAHMQAREDIYPFVFKRPKEDLHYPVLKDAQYRDYNLGIDHTITVSAPGFNSLLAFSVQERFRYPRYADRRDVTFTEHNNNSNQPSELYKIEATFMTYGYFDPDRKQFLEAIVLWVPIFKELLLSGNIPFERKPNPRSNQTFCCFKFDDLRKVPGLVKFYKRWDNGYSIQTTQPQAPINPITTHFRREHHRDESNIPRLC